MKITKRVREEAALICAIAASTPRECDVATCDYEVAKWLGIWTGSCVTTRDIPCVKLALAAWEFVFGTLDEPWTRSVDAEAEALLRTGWSHFTANVRAHCIDVLTSVPGTAHDEYLNSHWKYVDALVVRVEEPGDG